MYANWVIRQVLHYSIVNMQITWLPQHIHTCRRYFKQHFSIALSIYSLAETHTRTLCIMGFVSTVTVALLSVILSQVECSGVACSNPYPLIPGPPGQDGRDGRDGIQGVPGRTGDKGDRGEIGLPGETGAVGPQGPQGEKGAVGEGGIPGHQGAIGPPGSKGNTGQTGPKGDPGSVTEEEINGVCDNITSKIVASLQEDIQSLNKTIQELTRLLEVPRTLCNISSSLWTRVGFFDINNGDQCPISLRTVSNATTNQTACGRHSISNCISLPIAVLNNYTKVCGIVQGYQEASTDGFRTIAEHLDGNYVDGISITQGSPRRHLWTYVSGLGELAPNQQERCPCARSNPSDRTGVPSFVGEHFYCESGFSVNFMFGVIAWDDPLWDGADCQAPGNLCCERYGWFYRDVPSSSDDIELRICGDEANGNEDTLLSMYEFWVM